MKPSVGRVVHYVKDGQHWPAIVVAVLEHRITLFVMTNWAAGNEDADLEPDPAGAEGTWHWPERVE